MKKGDLIRRLTDGAIGEVTEDTVEHQNFVRANIHTHYPEGVYEGISVKEYEPVVPCECCGATGYRRGFDRQ